MKFCGTLQIGVGVGLLLGAAATTWAADPNDTPDESLRAELKNYPYRIVHESYRDGRWVLAMIDADGSNPVVLTRTPGAKELYPRVSPDGKKICFVCDEGEGKARRRNVYTMNMDGSGRIRVVEAGRDPCWMPDSKRIVYLKDEVDEFQRQDYATKGVFFYDLATRKHRPHVNSGIMHIYNIGCSFDGNWFYASLHAGMGMRHGILAIEAEGLKFYNLGLPGCRPDVSPDGKKIAWGANDYIMQVGDLDFSGPQPTVINRRNVATSNQPKMIYHIDWSPDGKYVAFSRGVPFGRLGDQTAVVGNKAEGWNICVADAAATNRWVEITIDGKSNKEPDWVPVKK